MRIAAATPRWYAEWPGCHAPAFPARLCLDRHVARLGGDALEPLADTWVALELEPTLVGHVHVAVERDVRERHRLADEPVAAVEVALHRGQRAVAAAVPLLEPVRHRLRTARVEEPEARHREVRLRVVLLEEEPLQHLRALERVVRDEARALAEEPEDRAGLADRAAVVEHDRRDAQRRRQSAEHLVAIGAVADVELLPLVRDPEVREQEANLVAVARDRAVVEQHGQTLVAPSSI